jgi:hypothetical protein
MVSPKLPVIPKATPIDRFVSKIQSFLASFLAPASDQSREENTMSSRFLVSPRRMLVALSIIGSTQALAGEEDYWLDAYIGFDQSATCSAPKIGNGADSARWFGKCAKGRINGDGRLVYYRDGKPFDVIMIGEEYGLQIYDGYLGGSMSINNIPFYLQTCMEIDHSFQAFVRAVVPKTFELKEDTVVVGITEIAKRIADSECSSSTDIVAVCINKEGDQTSSGSHCRVWVPYTRKNGTLESAGNYQNSEKSGVGQERLRDFIEEERVALTRSTFDQLKKEYQFESFMNLSRIHANPFAVEGKVIATYARFVRMLSRDKALFADNRGTFAVVSRLRYDRFMGDEEAIIIGTIRGVEKADIDSNKSLSVPLIELRKDHICTQPGCADII